MARISTTTRKPQPRRTRKLARRVRWHYRSNTVILRRPLIAALLAASLAGYALTARAVVVERVVAVVGEKAILQSDLRKRARPYLIKLHQKVPQGPQRAAEESRVYSQLIERMVEEELEQNAASRSNTRVDANDVDRALSNLARASGGITLAQLLANVRRDTGMTELEYRQEVRRQVLEGKLLNRRIQNQRVTRGELEAMFARVVKRERSIRLYNPAWIVWRTDPKNKDQVAQQLATAGAVYGQLSAGADWGKIVLQYSQDPATRESGGDLGIRAPIGSPKAQSGNFKTLSRELESRLMQLEPGEIVGPFVYKDAIVIAKLLSRQPSRYTSLKDAQAEIMQRVRAQKLHEAKLKWLKDLRRSTYVDVRL